MKIIKKLTKIYRVFEDSLDKLQPFALLGIRIWVAMIFFKAGLVKIDDMENTLLLFEYEYQVPFLPIGIAAYSATISELFFPVLIVLGVFTRLSVIPLLVMTAVIQFTYQEHLQHYYWAMMMVVLAVFGAGKWSIDYLLSYGFPGKLCRQKTQE